MFAIIADQVDSAHREDLVDEVAEALNHRYRRRLPLAFERTAGDEIEGVADDAAAALAILLELTRSGAWSVGLGVGGVEAPLPATVRSARGTALTAARRAIAAAKRRRHRFALRLPEATAGEFEVEPMIDLVLHVRSRRTVEGWQVYDLLGSGLTVREAARRLVLTQTAVGQIHSGAAIELESQAIPTLAALLASLDEEGPVSRRR